MTMILPVFLCDSLFRSLALIAESRPPDVVIGGMQDPYLHRWHVTPKGDGPSCYLHHFLRSDDDRALHDHPYASTSIILRGAYLEHLPGSAAPHLRVRGQVVHRDAVAPHRVELLRNAEGQEVPCWSLFLTGPRVRDWGFHCPQGWVPWQRFTDPADPGAVGPGCG